MQCVVEPKMIVTEPVEMFEFAAVAVVIVETAAVKFVDYVVLELPVFAVHKEAIFNCK